MSRLPCRSFLLATVAALVAGTSAPAAAKDVTVRMSVAPFGGEANANSFAYRNAISADGRYVAFTSQATNLVPKGTTGVFVRDRKTGLTKNVSLGFDGIGPGEWIEVADISANGRFVAFTSGAGNLVRHDTNDVDDVFVTDRKTGLVRRASLGGRGKQALRPSGAGAISADGNLVAFMSAAPDFVTGDTNRTYDIFLRDLRHLTTERVSVGTAGSQGSGYSYGPVMSGNGRFVAFVSAAPDLVPDDTNGREDIFVRDRAKGITERVSLGVSGQQGDRDSAEVAISADGRFVAFASAADDLVPGDTNATWDIFLRDRQAGTTARVSVGNDGAQDDDMSAQPAITPDGRFVAFMSEASNLVVGDRNGAPDVFLRDRLRGTTVRISVSSSGAEGNRASGYPSIAANGRAVLFTSEADNLVPGDRNRALDVFLRILGP